MTAIVKSERNSWIFIASIVLLAALILAIAPEEQTLGSGIRSVYVHVALTWTSMLGIITAGLLGLVSAVISKPLLQKLAYTVTWIALSFFAAGFVMSMVAAGINWGSMFWEEPRTAAAIQILVAGLVIQIANSFSINYRFKGLLNAVLVLFMFWSILSIPSVLHPGNAARSSPTAIRLTFYSMFVLCTLAAGWIAWRYHSKQNQNETSNEPAS